MAVNGRSYRPSGDRTGAGWSEGGAMSHSQGASELQTASEFQAVAASTIDDLLRLRPETATRLGDHRFDDALDDLSATALDTVTHLLRRRRSELESLDPERLDAEDRVDYTMLAGEIDRALFEIEDVAAFTWDPLVYSVGEALYPLLTREVLPAASRLRAIAARLALVPARLELARLQLEAPPRVHLETALAQHPGTVAMVSDEVERLLAAEPGLRPLVEPAQRRALDALEAHAGDLENMLDGPHRDPRLGPELFTRSLALTLSSQLSPDELLARAWARLADVDGQIAKLAADYLGGAAHGTETVRAALDRLADDAPDDATILGVAKSALERCCEAVKASGVVSIPPDPMRIELMPVFRRGVAVAYCDPAGPLEEGGETSFAIAPTPDDWPATRKTSFYREYNSAMITDLTAHEAVPGHMLQLAHAKKFRGSTLVRQVLMSGTFVEGWAVHAERLMAEAGLGGLPVQLQQMKMQLRVAINAILDVSVHAGDLDEDGAIELMMTRGYQEEGEARGKWRRACLTSAQLSTYFVGYTELGESFAALGDTASYDELLAHGCPPPALVAGLLRR